MHFIRLDCLIVIENHALLIAEIDILNWWILRNNNEPETKIKNDFWNYYCITVVDNDVRILLMYDQW